MRELLGGPLTRLPAGARSPVPLPVAALIRETILVNAPCYFFVVLPYDFRNRLKWNEFFPQGGAQRTPLLELTGTNREGEGPADRAKRRAHGL